MKTREVKVTIPDFDGYEFAGVGDRKTDLSAELKELQYGLGDDRPRLMDAEAVHALPRLLYRKLPAPKPEVVCPHKDCGWSGKARDCDVKNMLLDMGSGMRAVVCPQCGRTVDFPDTREATL